MRLLNLLISTVFESKMLSFSFYAEMKIYKQSHYNTKFEDRFNKKYETIHMCFLMTKNSTTNSRGYNDGKKLRGLNRNLDWWSLRCGICHLILIENSANGSWNVMKNGGVRYADMESYHNMCHFYLRVFLHSIHWLKAMNIIGELSQVSNSGV